MKRKKLPCDEEMQKFISLEARLASSSFIGTIDVIDLVKAGQGSCDDSFPYVHCPFQQNIPLVIDVVAGQDLDTAESSDCSDDFGSLRHDNSYFVTHDEKGF